MEPKLAPTSSASLYVFGLSCWQGLCLGCQLWGKRSQQKSWDAESFINSRNYLQVELLWPRCTLTNTQHTHHQHLSPQDLSSSTGTSGRSLMMCLMMFSDDESRGLSHTTYPPPTQHFIFSQIQHVQGWRIYFEPKTMIFTPEYFVLIFIFL